MRLGSQTVGGGNELAVADAAQTLTHRMPLRVALGMGADQRVNRLVPPQAGRGIEPQLLGTEKRQNRVHRPVAANASQCWYSKPDEGTDGRRAPVPPHCRRS